MVAVKDITMNTKSRYGGLMKTDYLTLKNACAGSVIMPYDEIYYQRMEDEETNLVRTISIAIKKAIDRMGKSGCA